MQTLKRCAGADRSFSLQPFPSARPLASLNLTGTIARDASNSLAIRYELVGPLAEVALPEPHGAPVRTDGLWKGTCFEFFLGIEGASGYWEFNLSPSGDWNVYRFTDYRQGMREEETVVSLPFDVRTRPDGLSLELEMALDGLAAPGQPLEAAVSAVIRFKGDEVTYWALAHRTGAPPDFHWRGGFRIALP